MNLHSLPQAIAGVAVVKAEMGKKDELITTLKGVDALFIVTPGTQERATLAIKTAEAAKAAGVKFLAVVSIPAADLPDTVFGKHFSEIEVTISKLGVPYTFIRLPFFVENYLAFKDGIVGQSTIYSPADPTKPFTTVVAEDTGKAAAAILVNPQKHIGKTYTIISDRHTHNDVTAAFSEVLGKEIKYVRVPYEAAKKAYMDKGFPEWRADGALEFHRHVDSGSPLANQANLGDFTAITGEQPTTTKSWVGKYGGAFQ